MQVWIEASCGLRIPLHQTHGQCTELIWNETSMKMQRTIEVNRLELELELGSRWGHSRSSNDRRRHSPLPSRSVELWKRMKREWEHLLQASTISSGTAAAAEITVFFPDGLSCWGEWSLVRDRPIESTSSGTVSRQTTFPSTRRSLQRLRKNTEAGGRGPTTIAAVVFSLSFLYSSAANDAALWQAMASSPQAIPFLAATPSRASLLLSHYTFTLHWLNKYAPKILQSDAKRRLACVRQGDWRLRHLLVVVHLNMGRRRALISHNIAIMSNICSELWWWLCKNFGPRFRE